MVAFTQMCVMLFFGAHPGEHGTQHPHSFRSQHFKAVHSALAGNNIDRLDFSGSDVPRYVGQDILDVKRFITRFRNSLRSHQEKEAESQSNKKRNTTPPESNDSRACQGSETTAVEDPMDLLETTAPPFDKDRCVRRVGSIFLNNEHNVEEM